MSSNVETDFEAALGRANDWYGKLEFIRSATSSDNPLVFRHGGTLWRDPDGETFWLHPQTVQAHRLVDKARAGIDTEQERLNQLRAEGGVEDPIFSEIDARTPKPRRISGQPEGREFPVASTSQPPGETAAEFFAEDAEEDTPPLPARAVSGGWNNWRWHVVGDQIAIDNKPEVEAYKLESVQTEMPPNPVGVVVPASLIKAISDAVR